tara:strand:- start:13165 stop:14157 length:993 start_codon:yes stop_codon:yes gene_type:complete
MLIVVGIIGLYSLSKTNDALNRTYEGNLLTLGDLIKVNQALLGNRVKITAEQRDRTPASAITTKQEVAENDAIIDAAWSDYFPERVSGDQERAIAESFIVSLASLRAGIDEINAAMIGNDYDAAREIATTTLRAEYPKVLTAIQGLIDRNSAQAAANNRQSSSDYVWTRNFVIGVMVAAIIFGILLSMWLVRGIMTPLGKAQALANAMAEGRLDNNVDASAKDEFGVMLRALKSMEAKFSQVVMSVRNNAESVNVAAGRRSRPPASNRPRHQWTKSPPPCVRTPTTHPKPTSSCTMLTSKLMPVGRSQVKPSRQWKVSTPQAARLPVSSA